MCSRLLVLALLCSLFSAGASAEIGGHRVDVGVWFGRMFFDADLRFEDDQVVGLQAAGEVTDWIQLSVSLGQMTMRDRKRDAWSESVLFEMMWRLTPLRSRHGDLGGIVGVSFMGFEEDEITDAVAEGLDLGLTGRRNLSERWRVGIDWFWRMQQFNLVPVDENGNPTGERDESDFVWSMILRGGLSYAF